MRSLVLLVSLAVAACSQAPGNMGRSQSAPADADTVRWDRSLECANRAERLIGRVQNYFGTSSPRVTVVGWNSHYGVGDRRCYVKVNLVNNGRDAGPPFYDELYDGVENQVLARHAGSAVESLDNTGYCFVPGEGKSLPTECTKALAFMQQKMTN